MPVAGSALRRKAANHRFSKLRTFRNSIRQAFLHNCWNHNRHILHGTLGFDRSLVQADFSIQSVKRVNGKEGMANAISIKICLSESFKLSKISLQPGYEPIKCNYGEMPKAKDRVRPWFIAVMPASGEAQIRHNGVDEARAFITAIPEWFQEHQSMGTTYFQRHEVLSQHLRPTNAHLANDFGKNNLTMPKSRKIYHSDFAIDVAPCLWEVTWIVDWVHLSLI